MQCPSCQSGVPEGARFCAYCGIALRVCPTCETVWPAEAAFCGVCGTTLDASMMSRDASSETHELEAWGQDADSQDLIGEPLNSGALGALYFPMYPDRRFELVEGELTIGAGDKNDIVIDRPAVSWNHALLIVRERCIKIQDSASTNGTFINEHAVSRPRELSHGDEVRFGNVKLKVWLKPSMR